MKWVFGMSCVREGFSVAIVLVGITVVPRVSLFPKDAETLVPEHSTVQTG
jgi:hypothetical protein